jgi:hypothetical protein
MGATEGPREAARPRWHWLAAAGVVLLVAGWLSFSPVGFVGCQIADTLIPKLASTLHWTVFYWDSDRLGQLLPLLAMPVQHPMWNLVVQVFLAVGAAALGFYLLAAFAAGGRDWLVTGTVTIGVFLLFAPPVIQWAYLEGSQTYAVGMCLLLGSLLLCRGGPWRRRSVARLSGALLLSALGQWVNLMAFCWAGALLAFYTLQAWVASRPGGASAAGGGECPRHDARRALLWDFGTSLVVLGVGLGVSLVARKVFYHAVESPWSHVNFELLPLREYPTALYKVSGQAFRECVGTSGALFFLVVFVAALLLADRQQWPRAVTPIVLGALAFVLFICGLKYVASNGYHYKYVLPSIASLYCAGAGVLVAAGRHLFSAQRRSRWVTLLGPAVAVAAVVLALYGRYGLPRPDGPRQAVAMIGGSPLAEQVVASRSRFVAGEYWTLWPVVFKANLLLHERGESYRVWGLGYRGSVTRHLWGLDEGTGPATLAYLKNAASQGFGGTMDWIANYLRLKVHDRTNSTPNLDFYTFELAERAGRSPSGSALAPSGDRRRDWGGR